jgi:glucose/arabinose dehydrogenase
MEEQLKIYRLVPNAPLDDPQWMHRPPQGEIVVRARTSGDARLVASEAELDFMEIDASPAEGNSTAMASAFRSEKLYTVIEDASGRFSADGPRQVVDGTVRIDTIVPVQVD